MIVINKGKMIAQGSVEKLLSNENIHVKVEVLETENAIKIIQNSAWSEFYDTVENKLIVMKLSKQKIPDFVKYLTQQNISIERVDYRNQLEEYFLKITSAS